MGAAVIAAAILLLVEAELDRVIVEECGARVGSLSDCQAIGADVGAGGRRKRTSSVATEAH
jgi:hypothetical protein